MKYPLLTLALFFAISVQAQFQLNGVATNLGGGIYRLTPASNNQFGAIWYKFQHNLNDPFNLQGQMNFGADPGGADGMVFVMQNGCLSAGGAGGGIGYRNIPGQSLGVEFDTYQNISGTGAELNNDPVFNHIAVEKNGDVAHDASANDITTPVQMHASLTSVKTGAWYDFQINYDPTTKLLRVFFDGSLRVSIVYDIQADVFGGKPWVYWGFTSSTGGFNNIQQINIDATLSNFVLTDASYCTGSVSVTLNPFTTLKGTNLALNNPVVASSNLLPASQAVDGNLGNRWESSYSDPQWIYVDLQSPTDIDSVTLDWEGAYATGYQIQISNDAVTWTPVFTTATGDGGHDKIVFSATNVRYVRMYGTTRATGYGYSLWEFGVYGQPKYLWSPDNGTVSPNIYSSTVTLNPSVTTTYTVMIPDPCLGYATHSMTVTVNCPAPVEFIDFTATTKNSGALLQWSTASEQNSDYFEILKSYDGINFKVIDYVNAAGNSTSLLTYRYEDNENDYGRIYYKLITVDLDGSRQESPVRSIQHDLAKITISNPVFENETNLILPAHTDWIEFSIVDMIGHTIYVRSMENPANIISIGEHLSAAAYLVLVKTETEVSTIKINKVR